MAPPVRFELTIYNSHQFIDNHYQYLKFYFHQDVRILTTHPFPFVVYGSFHYRDYRKTSIGYNVSVCSLFCHSDRLVRTRFAVLNIEKPKTRPAVCFQVLLCRSFAISTPAKPQRRLMLTHLKLFPLKVRN